MFAVACLLRCFSAEFGETVPGEMEVEEGECEKYERDEQSEATSLKPLNNQANTKQYAPVGVAFIVAT